MRIHLFSSENCICQSHFYEKKNLKIPIQHLSCPNVGYGNHASVAILGGFLRFPETSQNRAGARARARASEIGVSSVP